MRLRNPFKPTAGAPPPLLVGREVMVDQFLEGIEDGPGAPDRLTMFTGQRGVGKTVMLGAVAERVAADHQWIVLEETATPGFSGRLRRAAQRLLDGSSDRSVTGFTFPVVGGGMTLSPPDSAGEDMDLRYVLAALAEQCAERDTGVLLTLDEVHLDNVEELAQFSADLQHLIRDEHEIAVAFAGLPSAVDELLNQSQVTFLRRAERVVLGDVELGDVASSFEQTINEAGGAVSSEIAAALAAATEGYPFMIQLVGYHAWRKADGGRVDETACRQGIDQARTRLGSLVHAPALRNLSDVDRTFLVAMSQDDGPSTVSSIANRMNKNAQYVGVYRQRLLRAGMVRVVGYGQLEYAIPGLRDYLRDHATTLVAGLDHPHV